MQVDVGSETFDSFADLEFATAFLTGDIARAVGWARMNEDAQGRALVSATRMLLQMPWCVDPRPGPADEDIPAVISEVTAMLAADLAAKPRLFADASGNSNVKSAKAGSAQVEFFAPVDGGPPIPTALWRMLLNAGLVCLGSTGSAINDGAIVSGISDGYDVRPLGGRYAWDWPIAAGDHD